MQTLYNKQENENLKNAISQKISKLFTFTLFETEEECLNYILYKVFMLKNYITDGFSGNIDITKYDYVYDRLIDINIDKDYTLSLLIKIQQQLNASKN